MLDDIERQIKARFTELANVRRLYNCPVYALEHGLSADVIAKAALAASGELKGHELPHWHWHVWMALAAEAGYRYRGEEFWPFLERSAGEWKDGRRRERLRDYFLTFHNIYGGPLPVGRWADQFKLIAWPINHAILPRYLQDHFARHLWNLRFDLAHYMRSGADGIGRFLLERRDAAGSPRFDLFLQQTELTGAIVLALRDQEAAAAVPRISPDLLLRLVTDLETTQVSREYLREARAALKTRNMTAAAGLRRQQAPTRSDAAPGSSIGGLRIAAKLMPGEGLSVAALLPDFAAVLSSVGLGPAALSGTRLRFNGSASERWIPGSNLLTLSGKIRQLGSLPIGDSKLFELQNASHEIEAAFAPFMVLPKQSCWVLRRYNDGLYRQVLGGHIRPANSYIVLVRSPLKASDVAEASFSEVSTAISDLHAYRLATGDRLLDSQVAALERLGIGTRAGVTIRPAGLSPEFSIDGAMPTWLSNECIVLRLVADHDVLGFVASLDGGEALRISAQGPDLFLEIEPQAPGPHHLELAAIANGSDGRRVVASKTNLAFRVRTPQPWQEAVQSKAGFRLLLSPANAPLEEVLTGRATISVVGPPGRNVHWHLDTYDASDNLAVTRKGKATPIAAPPAAVVNAVESLRDAAANELDAAHRVVIRASVDELGDQFLSFAHKVDPVRWIYDSKKQTVRLIDEASHDSVVEIVGYQLVSPATPVELSADMLANGLRVEAPGMLLVASHDGRRQVALVSVPPSGVMKDFRDLFVSQALFLPPERPAALIQLIRMISLWSRARPIGQLAMVRKGKTLEKLRHQLGVLTCGAEYMRVLGDERPSAEQIVRQMIAASPGFASRMFSHAWTASIRETVDAFVQYAQHYKVEEDPISAASAAILAFDPNRLRLGYGLEGDGKADRLMAKCALLRGAFLAHACASAASNVATWRGR